jgi:hypothetical protein
VTDLDAEALGAEALEASEAGKYGGVLGLAAIAAAVLGADLGIVSAVVLGLLVAFACITWIVLAIFRWLLPYAIDAIRDREAEVQRARESAAMEPWWLLLDARET